MTFRCSLPTPTAEQIVARFERHHRHRRPSGFLRTHRTNGPLFFFSTFSVTTQAGWFLVSKRSFGVQHPRSSVLEKQGIVMPSPCGTHSLQQVHASFHDEARHVSLWKHFRHTAHCVRVWYTKHRHHQKPLLTADVVVEHRRAGPKHLHFDFPFRHGTTTRTIGVPAHKRPWSAQTASHSRGRTLQVQVYEHPSVAT